MTDPIVFVDLDGVLADFWSAAVRVHDRDPESISSEDRAEWNMAKYLTGGDDVAFWEKIDNDGFAFWAGLDPYPWAVDLWRSISGRWPRATILTNTPFDPEASAGKHAWIARHLTTRRFLIGAVKDVCAGPRHVLVDDSPANLEKFRGAGGLALGLQQPWCPEGVEPGRVVTCVADLLGEGTFHD